jgi:anti-anti-sigma factor
MPAVSAGGAMVSVSTPDNGVVASVAMTGEIDLAAEACLAAAVAELGSTAPSAVVIDVTEVTFAGSDLVNFLVRVRDVIPEQASMRIRGVSPLVRHMLIVTAVDQFVGLDDAVSAEAGHESG